MKVPVSSRARLASAVVAIVAAVCFSPLRATAHPPDILRNFRLLPRHSTLTQTGGFAGVNVTYNLSGRFGLVTGYESGFTCAAIGCPPPPLIPKADFIDVAIKALLNHPAVDAAPIPLERFVDLESLNGTFHDPNRLIFRGEDNQNAPFKLSANISGRIIHLVGRNDAPCCDFFNYKIDAYAHLAPFADFNSDGSVDAADYAILRNHQGMTSGATLEQGDADGDGDVDHDDYAAWKHDLGFVLDDMLLFDQPTLQLAVPEPATLVLTAIALFAVPPRFGRHGR